MKLTPKQQKFCDKYLECGNASEAYRFAYDCSRMKTKTIVNKAYELLKRGDITAILASKQAALEEKSELTKEQILDELACIIGSTISDYVNVITVQVPIPQTKKEKKAGLPQQYEDIQRVVFKDFDQITEKQKRAIESVKVGKYGIELKLHGKSWSIERMCKMLGYDAPAKLEARLMNEFETMTDQELEDYANGKG